MGWLSAYKSNIVHKSIGTLLQDLENFTDFLVTVYKMID